ncbi:MAG TPA: hypothetical protein VGK67_07325 [Myxococcales bacterium]|jgi:hypothetical protein
MTTSSCEDFVARLSGADAAQDSELQAHLSACEGCRGAARAVQALQRTAPSPSAETLGHFATRVRAAHLRSVDRQAQRAPLRTGLFAGLSAVGAAAAVGLVLQLAFPAPGPAPVGADEASVALVEPAGPAPEPALASTAADDDLFGIDEGARTYGDEALLDLFAAADDDALDDFDT